MESVSEVRAGRREESLLFGGVYQPPLHRQFYGHYPWPPDKFALSVVAETLAVWPPQNHHKPQVERWVTGLEDPEEAISRDEHWRSKYEKCKA
jgi:hypothetical protein